MTQSTCPAPTRSQRRWFDPRTLGMGAGSGLLGGLCCIAGAIAVGTSLAGLSAAGRLMDRYQPIFIAASAFMMAWWLLRTVRTQDLHRTTGRGRIAIVARALGRQLAPMGVVYAGMLLATMALSQALEAG